MRFNWKQIEGANPPLRRRLALIVAAWAVSCGALSSAHAAGLTCHADVYAKNRKPAAIKVVKFEYTTREQGTDVEELTNKRVAPGEEVDWNRVRLEKAAEGNVIIYTRIAYRNDTSGASNPSDSWGPIKWSERHPHSDSYKCLDDRNYAHYIDSDDVEYDN
jgi:hypothetical protein